MRKVILILIVITVSVPGFNQETSSSDIEWACETIVTGWFDGFKALIDEGMNIESTSTKYNNSRFIHLATEFKKVNFIKYLAEQGCDMNSLNGSGITSLEIAVSMGNYDIAKELLKNGADVNFLPPDFQTPLFRATVRGEYDEIQFYLKNGAKFTQYYHGESALFFYISQMIQVKKSMDERIIKLYLDYGFNPNQTDMKNYNLLHCLLMHPSISLETIKLLESYNININAQIDSLFTPLHMAVYFNNFEITEYLISKHADVNIKDLNGNTPLLWAVQNDSHTITEMLLEHGADINITNKFGDSPHSIASDEVKQLLGKYN